MITLQYLQELGTFTLELIANLKKEKELSSLRIRTVENDFYMYRYNDINMLGTMEQSNPLSDREIISIRNQLRNKLCLIKSNFIMYFFDLNDYKDTSFEEDFFALSTALLDEEIIELYLAHLVQDMLISTCSTDRILFNAPLLHEYYQNEQH